MIGNEKQTENFETDVFCMGFNEKIVNNIHSFIRYEFN